MLGRLYPSWVERTVNGTNDYTGNTFKAMLLKSSYTFNQSNVFVSELTSHELSGGNYVRANATGMAISKSGLIVTVTWAPIVFALITATGANAARSMVLYMVGASDAASPIILQQDFESAPDANNEDITITPSPSSGLIRYTITNP